MTRRIFRPSPLSRPCPFDIDITVLSRCHVYRANNTRVRALSPNKVETEPRRRDERERTQAECARFSEASSQAWCSRERNSYLFFRRVRFARFPTYRLLETE
jgi:hypothetical protein